jgi:FixJ family two-component response regulator
MPRERFHLLSPRERQVMGLVVSGRLNKQIADLVKQAGKLGPLG